MATLGLHPVYSPPVCLIECVQTRGRPYDSGDQIMNIPKISTQDTTLTISDVDGGKTTFPVPSGTEIDLHVAGLHYNRT